MHQESLFSHVTIIGFGLMGSSLARALRTRGLSTHLCACDRDGDVLSRAMSLELCDGVEMDVTSAVTGADPAVLAVPVGASGPVARAEEPGAGEPAKPQPTTKPQPTKEIS